MGELVTKSGRPVAKGRIRPALATAIRLIVEDGLSQAEAAKRVEMKAPSLSIALRKPHVVAFRAAVKRAWMASKTEQAWRTVAELADGAASEDVRLKASKVFLEASGELDGPNESGRKGPPSMVQINLQQAPAGEHPTPHRLPGVVEYQPPQRVRPDPSNLLPVGRGSVAGQDGA